MRSSVDVIACANRIMPRRPDLADAANQPREPWGVERVCGVYGYHEDRDLREAGRRLEGQGVGVVTTCGFIVVRGARGSTVARMDGERDEMDFEKTRKGGAREGELGGAHDGGHEGPERRAG